MSMLTALFRALRLTGWTLAGILRAAWLTLTDASALQRARATQWWSQGVLRRLNVRVHVIGTPPSETSSLIVSNHISWLDIPVLGATRPAHFLSKAEVRSWPVLGWLARHAGTLFIQRGAGHTESVARSMSERLLTGAQVVLFPEGTTSPGDSVRRFHPRLFRAAHYAQCPVIPVTLHYRRNHIPDTLAPFIDDDAFLPHLIRLLRAPATDVYLCWGSALPAGSAASQAQAAQRFCRDTLLWLNWTAAPVSLDSVSERFA